MPTRPSLVIGVIGHVDHGKTALVRALTGMETDRLAEERRRGISIALGFAHFTCNNAAIDLIDMPGHERFVRTMIAGATGIGAVLLVVAANEGVKPQTVEHVEIAALLGLRHAVIAVSKVDLVAPDQADLVGREASELASRAGLAPGPPVFTSAASGMGIEPLRSALGALVPEMAAPADDGFCYLPIDRSFSVAGYGTVVTGTLRRGGVAPGEELELMPGARRARIRGLEVHGARVDAAQPGQRVAVNLRGIETAAAPRGLALATPGMLEPSLWLTVALRATPSAPVPLRTASTLRLLFGTSEADAMVRLLDRDELPPDAACYAQLRCTPRVALPVREHLILRATSTHRTVAGGRVLEARAQRLRRGDTAVLARLSALEAAAPVELLAREVERAGPRGMPLPMLARLTGLAPARTAAALRDCGAVVGGGVAMTPAAVARAERAVLLLLERHWTDHKQGLTREQLLRGLRAVGGEVLDTAVQQLAARGAVQRAARIRLLRAEHEASTKEREGAAAAELAESFRRAGLTPPDPKPSDLATRHAMSQLVRDGVLVRAVDHAHKREFLFHRDAIDAARRVLTPLLRVSGQGLPVSDIGAALGISRKYSVPLLEHLDAIHFTRRVGDRRVLRQGE